MTTHRTTRLLAVALLATGATVTACGDEASPSTQGAQVPEAAEYNAADLTFATEMIPHHAQALMMVDLTNGRELSPEVAALTEEIRAAQAPEIEQMTDWLEGWDEPVPENPRDHANSGHDATDTDMPGMMSGEELEQLGSAEGAAFEEQWLEAMIAHHEGAVAMAQEEAAEGEFPEAVTLAQDVASSQQAEIERMQRLLGG